jgi:hypothetical protein
MNKNQKVLTVFGVVALGLWALWFANASSIRFDPTVGHSVDERDPAAGYLGVLLFIVLGYFGLMFALKSPKR